MAAIITTLISCLEEGISTLTKPYEHPGSHLFELYLIRRLHQEHGTVRTPGILTSPWAVLLASGSLGWPDTTWGFPKIRGPFQEVLVIRTLVYWIYSWAPVFGNSHLWALSSCVASWSDLAQFWLLLYMRGPFSGCPFSKSPTVGGLCQGS